MWTSKAGLQGAKAISFAGLGGQRRDGYSQRTRSHLSDECIWILTNNGQGSLQPPLLRWAGSPGDIALADVNRDGRLDIAIPRGGPGFTILLNQGAGQFGEPQTYGSVCCNVLPVVVTGDFDNDGDVDLAEIDAASFSVRRLSVFSNQGDGSFVLGASPIQQGAYLALMSDDLDGDGAFDLVIARRVSAGISQVMVLLGQAGGGFAAPVDYVTPSSGRIRLSDLNGDSAPDVVLAGDDSNFWTIGLVYVLYNNDDGTFTGPMSHADGTGVLALDTAPGDFDSDGQTDLSVSLPGSGVVILRKTGPTLTVPGRTDIVVVGIVCQSCSHQWRTEHASPMERPTHANTSSSPLPTQ